MSQFKWLDLSANEAAVRLLGCELERNLNGKIVKVKIVETESYDQSDPASHAFNGERMRNKTMFMSAGHLYVYFTYGMHFCCNIVCGKKGFGSGVLVRAVEPLTHVDVLGANRKIGGYNLTNGRAKLCQALQIDRSMDGHFLANPPLRLIKKPVIETGLIEVSKRVGISKAKNELKRFYIKNNPYVSKLH